MKRAGRVRILGTIMVVSHWSPGCAVAQRGAMKVVDPQLQAKGTTLEGSERRATIALGPYVARQRIVRAESAELPALFTHDARGRPLAEHWAGIVFEGAEARRWTTTCRLQRRPSAMADYWAMVDEDDDRFALDCIAIASGHSPWQLIAQGRLSENFVARWGPEPMAEQDWAVEVFTRVRWAKRIERILPRPVVQLRHRGASKLAMLLDRTPRVWVDEALDAIPTEATIAVMLTLMYLPWSLAQ